MKIDTFYFTIPLLLLLLMVSHPFSAQITIGLQEAPAQGALLQLKNIEVENENTNANKGLGMPRVELVDRDKLYPMYSYENNANTPTAIDKEKHIGLMVWNITENEIICPGLHVWDGNKWNNLVLDLDYIIDSRTLANGEKEVNTYLILTFEEAGTWMLTNLRASVYADGAPSTGGDMTLGGKYPITDFAGKYYYYPPVTTSLQLEKDEDNFLKKPQLGLLYTWAAATAGNKNNLLINEGESYTPADMGTPSTKANPMPSNVEQVGIQGVCPNGWHLPSDKEMNDLEKYISNDQEGKTYDQETGYTPMPWNEDWRITLGGLNANRGTHSVALVSQYDGLNPIGKSNKACSGTTGFSVYQVGYIYGGSGGYLGRFGDYWTSSKGTQDTGSTTTATQNRAWYRGIGTSVDLSVHRRAGETSIMMSVRCKRNE